MGSSLEIANDLSCVARSKCYYPLSIAGYDPNAQTVNAYNTYVQFAGVLIVNTPTASFENGQVAGWIMAGKKFINE